MRFLLKDIFFAHKWLVGFYHGVKRGNQRVSLSFRDCKSNCGGQRVDAEFRLIQNAKCKGKLQKRVGSQKREARSCVLIQNGLRKGGSKSKMQDRMA